ncbi:MAG: flagellar hook capping FlgD N-terminal domain-containing protein [Chitinophagales bacterium]
MQVQGASGATVGDAGSTQFVSNSNAMGKDEFLQLLMAQMRNQDPMTPMDNTQFVAQMAQFSSLEQMTTLNATLSDLATSQRQASLVAEATALLGRTVTVQVDGETSVTGKVQSVRLVSGWPKLVIDGQPFDPANVSEVA